MMTLFEVISSVLYAILSGYMLVKTVHVNLFVAILVWIVSLSACLVVIMFMRKRIQSWSIRRPEVIQFPSKMVFSEERERDLDTISMSTIAADDLQQELQSQMRPMLLEPLERTSSFGSFNRPPSYNTRNGEEGPPAFQGGTLAFRFAEQSHSTFD